MPADTGRAMGTTKRLQIFKPGRQITSAGEPISFSESDLLASAKAYDPKLHEAPIVVGHPKDTAPAYGWIKSVSFEEKHLEAVPHQVDPAFAEMVNGGKHFKKMSAQFYRPESPNNPVPGVWYLRHVAFLGAQPPAVKGLRDASFSDSETGVVEFTDWDGVQVAGLFRSMRDWLIGKFGQDEADKALPPWNVDGALLSAATSEDDEDDTTSSPSYTEGNMTPAQIQAREAELATREAALKTREQKVATTEASFSERQTQLDAAAAKARRQEFVDYAEVLFKAGKLLPEYREGLASFMADIRPDEVVEFGEGNAKKSEKRGAWLKDFISKHLKQQVSFGEHARESAVELDDPSSVAAAAVEFQESEAKVGRRVDIATAVAHVNSKRA
jgi:hypothetical protein